jgi:hypothetical protein
MRAVYTVIRLLSVPVLLAAAGGFWYMARPATVHQQVEVLDPARVVVVRTEGGHLQVSELRKPEEFAWQTSWSCALVDCSRLPKTKSTITATAVYVYRLPLAAEWRLELKTDHYLLSVPTLELQTPVALDTVGLAFKTETTILAPSAAPNRELLLQKLGPELAQRGSRSDYLRLQQSAAEATVREFAHKWMQRDNQRIDKPLRVVFQGSSAVSL